MVSPGEELDFRCHSVHLPFAIFFTLQRFSRLCHTRQRRERHWLHFGFLASVAPRWEDSASSSLLLELVLIPGTDAQPKHKQRTWTRQEYHDVEARAGCDSSRGLHESPFMHHDGHCSWAEDSCAWSTTCPVIHRIWITGSGRERGSRQSGLGATGHMAFHLQSVAQLEEEFCYLMS